MMNKKCSEIEYLLDKEELIIFLNKKDKTSIFFFHRPLFKETEHTKTHAWFRSKQNMLIKYCDTHSNYVLSSEYQKMPKMHYRKLRDKAKNYIQFWNLKCS